MTSNASGELLVYLYVSFKLAIWQDTISSGAMPGIIDFLNKPADDTLLIRFLIGPRLQHICR